MAKKLLTYRPDFPKKISYASRNKKMTKNDEKRHFLLIKSTFHVRIQILFLESYQMGKTNFTCRPDFPDSKNKILTQTVTFAFCVIELILCLGSYEMAKKLLTCRPDFP